MCANFLKNDILEIPFKVVNMIWLWLVDWCRSEDADLLHDQGSYDHIVIVDHTGQDRFR